MYLKSLADFKAFSAEMIRKDRDRDQFFEKIDQAVHVEWEKPVEWREIGWIRAFKTSDTSSAMDASIKTLATNHPSIKILPTRSDPVNKQRFEDIQRGVDWLYRQAERRRDTNPTKSIVDSCLRYEEYAAQVTYLPHQIKALGTIKGTRAKRAGNFGPFLITVHNPKTVHTLYSDYMLEKLLLVKRARVHDVIDFWGDLAKDLRENIESSASDGKIEINEVCDIYDYWDDEQRVVWVSLSGSGSGSEFPIIAPGSDLSKNDLGFIPWAHGVGGSSMDDREDYKRKPLLNNVIRSGSWHNQQIFGSLMFSLAMQRAAMPVLKTETPSGEGVDIDVTEPVGQLALRTGEQATNMLPAGIDPAVEKMFDRLSTFIGAESGTHVLQNLNFPRGSAYATINAIIQAAVSVLDPFKQLAEQGIGDVIRREIEWLKHEKADLTFYKMDPKADSADGSYGEEASVPWDQLPEQEDLYITVVLKPSVPTDEMQRINGAQIMANQLHFPIERALEQLDVTDPSEALKEWRQEQEDNAAMQVKLSNIQFENQLMQQAELAKFQQQQAQQQQQGQSGQNPQDQMGQMGPQGISQGPMEAAQGPGFNPAISGTPPSVAAPTVNREQITGSTGQAAGPEGGQGTLRAPVNMPPLPAR